MNTGPQKVNGTSPPEPEDQGSVAGEEDPGAALGERPVTPAAAPGSGEPGQR